MNAWRLLYAETHIYMITFSIRISRSNRDDLFLQLSGVTTINIAGMQGDFYLFLSLLHLRVHSQSCFLHPKVNMLSGIYRIQINKEKLLHILSMLHDDGDTFTQN